MPWLKRTQKDLNDIFRKIVSLKIVTSTDKEHDICNGAYIGSVAQKKNPILQPIFSSFYGCQAKIYS